MTTRESYLQAQFPDRFKVLRWRLQSLSLGHALLLEWIESPFVNAQREPGAGDLAFALAICHRDFGKAKRLVYSRWRSFLIRRYVIPQRDFVPACFSFLKYLEYFATGPKCWTPHGGGSRGAPFYETVKITHVAKLHKTEAQALDTPLTLALHDYAAFWEMQQQFRIMGDADESILQLAKEVAENPNGRERIPNQNQR